jgi:hypothetical protein
MCGLAGAGAGYNTAGHLFNIAATILISFDVIIQKPLLKEWLLYYNGRNLNKKLIYFTIYCGRCLITNT